MPDTPSPLRLFDSFTRQVRDFAPIEGDGEGLGHVRVYSCGPTVYHYAHLGNLRAYVFTDTLTRALRWKGYGVTHVINITDVGHLTSDADVGDDKMETAATREAKTIWDVARFYTEAFKSDIAALNVAPPTRWAVATDHIAEMINFAKKIAPAHCYEIPSGLYFDSTTVPDYGKLAGGPKATQEARIDEVEGKRHATDFAIWRRSQGPEQRQMEWDSPWGRGAPGWHLECSVMSNKYLGEQFDIHTGGIDHREIHHPNEIAQNQAHSCTPATGANWWMHNNFLVDRSAKMSKSTGEFLTLQAIVDKGIHPLAYRLMCLQAHYRSELEFSWENLAAAFTRLKRLVLAVNSFLARDGHAASWDHGDNPSYLQSIIQSIASTASEELATPQLLVLLDEVLSSSSINPAERHGVVRLFDELLGLALYDVKREHLRVRPYLASIDDREVAEQLKMRKYARAVKDFATSDRIRDELAAAGVEVMDGDPLGWDWKLDL